MYQRHPTSAEQKPTNGYNNAPAKNASTILDSGTKKAQKILVVHAHVYTPYTCTSPKTRTGASVSPPFSCSLSQCPHIKTLRALLLSLLYLRSRTIITSLLRAIFMCRLLHHASLTQCLGRGSTGNLKNLDCYSQHDHPFDTCSKRVSAQRKRLRTVNKVQRSIATFLMHGRRTG